ncbi:hypothetical protein [Halarcobacter sp.]|uniref:hypothetical protein n=1 Tax=Halarcobacter sp. TaxID=2321133 RepID=UPI002AAAC75D|nr:hypothetical protein [Halarcobacter sp.]
MYFWNINSLKNDIRDNGFNDRFVFPYILVYVIITTFSIEILRYTGVEEGSIYEYFYTALVLILSILGTIYIYKKNGMENGNNFANKFFTIGLVVLIRTSAYFILFSIFIAFILIAFFSDDILEESLGFIELLYIIFYYYILGNHILDIKDV